MSSSSRSIAAARQRRAGEQTQQNNSRPVTSISSQGAFAQQYQQQQQQQQQQRMGQNIPIGSKNGRVAQAQAQGASLSANYQTSQQSQQTTKISISNAVGLITLRLGKLEQIINDMNFEEGGVNLNNNGDGIPSNMKIVSDEVFENIVNRLNLLESKLLNSKNMESHVEKIERDMREMKRVITNSQNSLSIFMSETNVKFTDVETALALIEENAQINIEGTSENIEVNENIDENVALEYAETNETNENSETSETSENNENSETKY
jgi:hypothetical protein